MKDFSNEAYFLLFSALANRTRLAIIDVLKDSPKSVSEISAALKQEQDTVVANLKPLEQSALVISTSFGNERLYSLNKEIIEPLADLIEFHTAKHCPGLRACIPQEKLREYMKKEAEKWTYVTE
jgi:DNA-binding transcriptional ArsR family regulator